MQEAYPFTVKPKGQAKDQWDLIALGAAVPGANEPLEVLGADQRAEPLFVVTARRSPGARSRARRVSAHDGASRRR